MESHTTKKTHGITNRQRNANNTQTYLKPCIKYACAICILIRSECLARANRPRSAHKRVAAHLRIEMILRRKSAARHLSHCSHWLLEQNGVMGDAMPHLTLL